MNSDSLQSGQTFLLIFRIKKCEILQFTDSPYFQFDLLIPKFNTAESNNLQIWYSMPSNIFSSAIYIAQPYVLKMAASNSQAVQLSSSSVNIPCFIIYKFFTFPVSVFIFICMFQNFMKSFMHVRILLAVVQLEIHWNISASPFLPSC